MIIAGTVEGRLIGVSDRQHVEMIIEYIRYGGNYQYFDNHGYLTRCMDCEYFLKDKKSAENPVAWCNQTNKVTHSNDFCSWAKREGKSYE